MRNPLFTLFGLLFLLLASCGADRPMREEKGGPALWRVDKDGRSAHIFGTIHVLPPDVAWETPQLREAMAASDRLVLEATGLDDVKGSQKIFVHMGRSPGLPPIAERVPKGERPVLEAMIKRGEMSETVLSGYESWAAALLLQTVTQADANLTGGEGVEPALTRAFNAEGKPIEGLETIAEQFALFDTQPEKVQRKMLVETIRQSRASDRDFRLLVKAWLTGDMRTIERRFIKELAPDKALVGPLLTNRNKAWADKVAAMPGTPFIAVGAAHLAGPDNLIALLTAKGYRATRIQ